MPYKDVRTVIEAIDVLIREHKSKSITLTTIGGTLNPGLSLMKKSIDYM